MAQNYIVFTEKKTLHVGSYEHQSCEIVTEAVDFPSKKWWNHIHDQTNTALFFNIDFNSFKAKFKIIRAAGGIVRSNNSLLMIYRNAMWDLPKGWIEADEFPLQAALREVVEECGQMELVAESIAPIKTYHLYPLKGQIVLKETHWFLMTAAPPISLVPQRKEGITEAVFKAYHEVDELMQHAYPMIRWIWDEISE